MAAIFLPSNILAKGIIAVWDMGTATQAPYPVKNSTLELDKVTVVFRGGKVKASYRVKNPNHRSIDVTIGLPLEYSRGAIKRKKSTKNLLNSFSIRVNGEDPGASWLTENAKSTYPLVVNWLMTFPAGSTTEMVINYPSETKVGNFQFFTQTGALWSKPIGKAVFRYCERDASTLGRSGTQWTDGGWSLKRLGLDAGPKPFDFNKESGCVVWERTDWQPSDDSDSLSIKKGNSTLSYKYPWAYDAKMGDFYNSSMTKWCHPGEGKSPFAETIGLDKASFNSLNIEELTRKSYIFIAGTSEKCRDGRCDPFYSLPDHLATDYKLWLLRYLRNSVFARYGASFDDEEISKCFSSVVPIKGERSQLEKNNTRAIYQLERQIRQHNTKAWDAVKKDLPPDSIDLNKQARADNIYITDDESAVKYKAPWGYDTNLGTFFESTMSHWCHPDEKVNKKTFAEMLNLDKVVFSSLDFEGLVKQSYSFITGKKNHCKGDKCDPFYTLPEHFATDYQLWLLRYLRNSVFAKYGASFDDDEISKCFSSVKPVKGERSLLEKKNTRFIYQFEQQIRKRNTKAWDTVRKGLPANSNKNK